MSQIGTIRLETGSQGIVEIPIFELGDVSLSAWRVETESGTGAVNLVDPANAELDQVRIQTSQGVKAVSTSISSEISLIADFTLNGQNLNIVVYEDIDDDGDAEYIEKVELQEGKTNYKLDYIPGLSSSTFWIQSSFENPDIEKTAKLNEVTLELKNELVVDDFERGDLSPYSGEKSWFDIISSGPEEEVYKGENALKATSNGGAYVITANEGLENNPVQGNSFEIWYYAGETGEPQQAFLWGVQDSDNWYGLEVNNDPPDDVLYLRKDGSVLDSTGSGDVTPRDEWQRIKIEWKSDGTMIAELYNSNGNPQYTVTAKDEEYSAGGIGFRSGASSGGSKSWWDNFRILD